MTLPQKPYLDYASLGDTGTDLPSSTQPCSGEPATPAVINRQPENLRRRTEALRAAIRDLFYYRDHTRYTLVTTGQLTWEVGGVGRVNNTNLLYIEPFLNPRTDLKGQLTLGTAASNQLLYTVQASAYAADGVNAITVEHRHSAGLATPTAMVSAGPVYRILVVFDSSNVAHDAATVLPIVNAAVNASSFLNGKLVVTANAAPGVAILATVGQVSIDTTVHSVGQGGHASADLERHEINVGALGAFTTTNPLAEGDMLALRYDYVTEPSPSTGGGRAESNSSRGTGNADANLFRVQDYPEWMPGCIPLCKVVNGKLVWCDGTILATGATGVPGDVAMMGASIAWGPGPAWANGDTNPLTTVDAQLTKIVADLAAAAGAARIGVAARTTWFGGQTNPATTIYAAINKIIGDLKEGATSQSGARLIGVEGQTVGSKTLGLGSLFSQLTSLLTYVNTLQTELDETGREAERRALLTPSIMPTTAGTSYGLVGVASDGAGNVAAVGHTGGASYAQDSLNHGATWAQTTLSATMEEVYAVAWNGDVFCALGYNTAAGGTVGIVHRTATGAWSAWVAVSGAGYGSKLTAITWTGSAWVAVGEDGKAWYTTSSTPSSGWTEVTAYTGMTNDLFGIASSATRTVACGHDGWAGDGRITHTADPTAASAWTVVTLPNIVGGLNFCYCVATDGAGRWVFGQDEGYVAVTDNLTTFTSYLIDSDGGDVGAICHTGKHYVALNTSSGQSKIFVSKDGIAWVTLELGVANVKAINAESFCYVAGQIGSDKALFRSGSLL